LPSFIRSHKNHLQSGLLNAVLDPRLRDFATPIFYTKLGADEGQPRTPWQEALTAVGKIYEDQTDPISLCVSGGVDSECMLRAFHAAKKPFRTFIFRYLGNYPWSRDWNHHDTVDAFRLCRKLDIQPEVLKLNALTYFDSGQVFSNSEKYTCASPQLCLHIEFLKKVPGCPVLAWNAPNFQGHANPQMEGLGLPGFLHFSYNRYFEESQRAGIPFFFLYTPELFYSFFKLERFRKQRANPKSTGSYELKCDLYRDGGFHIQNRPDKFTGFEELRRYYDLKYRGMDVFNQKFRQPLNEKLRNEKRLPNSEISLVQEEPGT